jgi:hypothetical protein
LDIHIQETTEEVSSHPGETGHSSQKKHRNTPGAREKSRANWKKTLANQWNRKKITKKAHAGRGQETKWEIPFYMDQTDVRLVDKKPNAKCQLKLLSPLPVGNFGQR